MNICKLFVFVFCFSLFDLKISFASKKPKIIGVVGTIEGENNVFRPPISFYWIQPKELDNFANACAGQNVSFVMLPLDVYQVKKLADTIDGLVLTGGIEDLASSERSNFETKILDEVIKQKKQVLGICRGFQFINYYFYKDKLEDKKSENVFKIIDRFPQNSTTHINPNKKYVGLYSTMHKVKLNPKSRLSKILNKTEINVNSAHNYAIDKIDKKVLVYGISPEDGVPEMIEIKNYPKFFMGVQWHPEYLSTDDDVKLLQSFCKAVVNDN